MYIVSSALQTCTKSVAIFIVLTSVNLALVRLGTPKVFRGMAERQVLSSVYTSLGTDCRDLLQDCVVSLIP